MSVGSGKEGIGGGSDAQGASDAPTAAVVGGDAVNDVCSASGSLFSAWNAAEVALGWCSFGGGSRQQNVNRNSQSRNSIWLCKRSSSVIQPIGRFLVFSERARFR